MASMLDYIAWRGDLSFSLAGPNEVDALIFSTLSYIPFQGSAERNPEKPILLRQAAREFFDHPDPEGYVRSQNDLELLKAAGESRNVLEESTLRNTGRFSSKSGILSLPR